MGLDNEDMSFPIVPSHGLKLEIDLNPSIWSSLIVETNPWFPSLHVGVIIGPFGSNVCSNLSSIYVT